MQLQEALAIARYFDVTGDGKVDYEEFCNGISELQEPFVGGSKRLNEVFSSVSQELICGHTGGARRRVVLMSFQLHRFCVLLQDLNGYRSAARVENTKLEGTKAIGRSFRHLRSACTPYPCCSSLALH